MVCSWHSVAAVASSGSPFGDSSNMSTLLNSSALSVHQRRGLQCVIAILGRELCLVCSWHSVASSRLPFGDSSNISALLNCLILSVHQRRGVRPSSNMRFPCQSVKSGQSPHLFLRMSGIRTCRRGCILQSRCPRARFMVACGCAETTNDLRQENKYKQNKNNRLFASLLPPPFLYLFFWSAPSADASRLRGAPCCGAQSSPAFPAASPQSPPADGRPTGQQRC